MLRLLFLLFITLHIVGCGHFDSYPEEQVPEVKQPKPVVLDSLSLLKNKLLAQYAEWKGTKYQVGGLSKKGIDCSGFLYLTFRSVLGVDLPRSTRSQVNMGLPVQRDDLRVGDLVFFKTGRFSRHVGVYMGDNNFLHASSTLGITITSLKDDYWAKKYWLSKRIIT